MEDGKQMRFSDEELLLIKSTFKNNTKLLKLMRKVFLPEIDPDAPLGQMIDLWTTVEIKDKPQEDVIVSILARNSLILHVEQQLIQLNVLAEMKELSEEEKKKRAAKDSSK